MGAKSIKDISRYKESDSIRRLVFYVATYCVSSIIYRFNCTVKKFTLYFRSIRKCLLQTFTGSGHNQLPMLYPLDPDQLICNLLNIPCHPADHQDLKAVVCIQMNMEGRDYLIVMGMLLLGQLVRKIPDMMVIYQGDSTDRLLIINLPFQFH